MPAEWEPVEAVLLSWPHEGTDWEFMLDEVLACYREMARAISRHARVYVVAPEGVPVDAFGDNPVDDPVDAVWRVPTDDTWIRDYGPVTVFDDAGHAVPLDFQFNAWGLKFGAANDNQVNSALHAAGLLHGLADRRDFVLEGGSIESDGKGTILTTAHCLTAPNRNDTLGLSEICARLERELGARRVLALHNGHLTGDDTDGHIDTLARFLPGDAIAYVACHDSSHPDYASLRAMEDELKALRTVDGHPYRLVALPAPAPVHDPADGHILPASYANFLIVNGAVILPVYGQTDADREAAEALADALPGYIIETVDCRALIRQHGSLHCATMQLPRAALADSRTTKLIPHQ